MVSGAVVAQAQSSPTGTSAGQRGRQVVFGKGAISGHWGRRLERVCYEILREYRVQ
jgi:hypothetical protein